MNSALQLFENLLVSQGVEPGTDEMALAKLLVFYVLKKWLAESVAQANPPLHFCNLYESNKTVVVANVTVILEHMEKLTVAKKTEELTA